MYLVCLNFKFAFSCIALVHVVSPFLLEHVLIAFLMESRNRYKKRISLCHWNIEGFKSSKYSKFQDKEFIDEITKHDVIALTETHAGKGDKLGVEGYTTFLSCRGKHKKARKHSGGVAILVRNYLIRGVEIIRSSSDLMWVRLDKQFFEFKEDLYVGVVYISPQNSVGTRELSEKAWEDLDRDMLLIILLPMKISSDLLNIFGFTT